ncbi:MAG: SDR family oxidoreductase [Paracoccaceae bacterium]|nr:SDR family oxidoreductase [Paracoccaceae bacterium]
MSERALATGAASGIGRAAAIALKARGPRSWRSTATTRGAAADAWVQVGFGRDAEPFPPSLEGFDILVNSAGLPPREGTEALVLEVNFCALRRLTEAAIGRMSAGGRVVNVASKAGAKWRENIGQVRRLVALPEPADLDAFVAAERIDPVRAYDLSKEAVIAWTKAMKGPLISRGLRMNCVSPAAVDTPLLDDFTAAFGDHATKGIEMTGRPGRVEEIAEVIAFLAGPGSGWVRGCNIEVDGGLTALLETCDAGLTVRW